MKNCKHPEVRIRPKEGENLDTLVKRVTSALGKAGHKNSIKAFKDEIQSSYNDETMWNVLHEWITILEQNKAPQNNQLTALEYLKEIRTFIPWYSVEQRGKKPEKMSNSELMRILDAGNIHFNGEVVDKEEVIDFPVFSIVMFPTSEVLKNSVL